MTIFTEGMILERAQEYRFHVLFKLKYAAFDEKIQSGSGFCSGEVVATFKSRRWSAWFMSEIKYTVCLCLCTCLLLSWLWCLLNLWECLLVDRLVLVSGLPALVDDQQFDVSHGGVDVAVWVVGINRFWRPILVSNTLILCTVCRVDELEPIITDIGQTVGCSYYRHSTHQYLTHSPLSAFVLWVFFFYSL